MLPLPPHSLKPLRLTLFISPKWRQNLRRWGIALPPSSPHPLRWILTLVSCPSPTTAPSRPYQGAGRPHPRPSSKPLYPLYETPFTNRQSVWTYLLRDCSSLLLWPQCTQNDFNLCPVATVFGDIYTLDVLTCLYQEPNYPHPWYLPCHTSPFEFAHPGYFPCH